MDAFAACRRSVRSDRPAGVAPLSRPSKPDARMNHTTRALQGGLALLVAFLALVLPGTALAAPPAAATTAPATEMVVEQVQTEAVMEVEQTTTLTAAGSDSLSDAAPAPEPAEPPAPVAPEPVTPAPEPAPSPEPAAPAEEVAPAEPVAPAQPAEGDATATNESRTFQVLVQVQRGCRSNCRGTSQTQVAEQIARTIQDARADAPAGGAEAVNRSATTQFVWQAQLGCVAFCYATNQLQLASQAAETVQSATAAGAAAANAASTQQFAFQYQRGCRYECYGTVQSQALAQQSATSQTADAGADDESDLAELRLAFGTIEAWAANLNATVQLSFQFQDADCRRDCDGGAQTQLGVQYATTVQHANAGVQGGAGTRLE